MSDRRSHPSDGLSSAPGTAPGRRVPEGGSPEPSARERLISVLLRPTPPPATVGLITAAAFIGAETVMLLALKQLAPDNSFGMLYLIGVLVVATVWGSWLAVLASVASAAALDYFRNWPDAFVLNAAENWTTVGIVLGVALVASTLADLARARAVEADQRRREAEHSREELRVLADHQAAVRGIATMVARGVAPSQVFAAVATDLARIVGVWRASVIHCRPDTGCTVLAVSGGPSSGAVAAGEQSPVEWEGLVTTVLATGRAASADIESPGDGGVRSAVAVPIVVDHTPWGAVLIVSSGPRLAADVETRVADFADLLSTAISNAETRRQLTASRARIVAATDEARRRVERDLHDGAQQRLVSLGLQLRTVEASLSSDPAEAKRQIADVIVGLTAVSHDLQEISRGIHPAILSSGGLGPALKTLARRSAVPVELHHDVDRRLPQAVEVAAYYVVAEALTNAAKHARASQVDVAVEMTDANLHVVIRDDGVGGADTGKGSGLIGLQDRVEALGGQMILSSQTGRGTSLVFDIPLRSND